MKNDFRQYGEKVQEKQKEYKIQIQKLKSQNTCSEDRIIHLQSELKKVNLEREKTLDRHHEEINIYKEQLQKIKLLIVKKDREISKLTQQNSENIYKNVIPLNPVRECNHFNLIEQLEKNIALKEKQNEELSQKVQAWSQYIGLDKSFNDKKADLSSAAETAMNCQMNFVKNLKKRSKK